MRLRILPHLNLNAHYGQNYLIKFISASNLLKLFLSGCFPTTSCFRRFRIEKFNFFFASSKVASTNQSIADVEKLWNSQSKEYNKSLEVVQALESALHTVNICFRCKDQSNFLLNLCSFFCFVFVLVAKGTPRTLQFTDILKTAHIVQHKKLF